MLAQPRLDNGALEPGGAATAAIRAAASKLEFVKSGAARVRITGNVALSDEEFASVAKGAVAGMIGSVLLISLWLFLAVRTWRLIVPILLTLGLGLMLTLLFAAAAVGTLNLVSVGFGILFVGIAVDFAIQFCVRYREMRWENPDHGAAMAETGRRVGGQILVAAAATSAGFLAFVPTEFRGVAELGLIAGVGMLIAFLCTMTFLPAAISLFRPRAESAAVGFRWAAPLDEIVRRHRRPLLGAVCRAGRARRRSAATAALRLQSAAYQEPAHRSDADPFRLDGFAGHQPVYDRPPDCERCCRRAIVGAAAGVAAGLGSVVDRQLCAQRPEGKARTDRRCGNVAGPNPQPAGAGPAADARKQIRIAAKNAYEAIAPALTKSSTDPLLGAIAGDLRRVAVAPDPVVLAMNRALTRFLPAQLDQLRTALSAATGDLAEHSAGIGPRLGPARRSGAHPGLAQVRGERQPRLEGIRRSKSERSPRMPAARQ